MDLFRTIFVDNIDLTQSNFIFLYIIIPVSLRKSTEHICFDSGSNYHALFIRNLGNKGHFCLGMASRKRVNHFLQECQCNFEFVDGPFLGRISSITVN